MRSAIISSGEPEQDLAALFTAGESSFRNPKLSTAVLVAYKAFADVAAKASLFVITIVAAHQLTPWAFGVFGLGTTIGWMLSVAADFGVQMHLARAVASAPRDARALLRRWWRVRVAATAASLGVLVGVLLIGGAGRAIAVPLVAFAAAYACGSLVEFLNYFYRGLSRSDIESTLTLWQRGGTLVLAVAVLAIHPEVTSLALAMLAPAAAALVWSGRLAMGVGTYDSPAPVARAEFLRDVFPIGLGIVLSAVYFRVDVLLVERWAGTEAVAGYNAVFRLIDALRLFPAALLAVVLPMLCAASDLRPVARVSAGVSAFGVLAGAAVWVTADRSVPLLFGSAYVWAVPALRILALSLPLLCLNFALTHQLVAWNRQRAYAAICAGALALNLALNAWLIPLKSVEGAAWATLGTEVGLTAACVVALVGRR
jgi:O-antigen/teichoic acid export membrane protein